MAGPIATLDTRPRGGRQAAYRETYCRWRETSDEAFAQAVRENSYVADVLRALRFELSGGNYAAVRRRVRRLKLDTNHWRRGRPPAGRPLDLILVPRGYTNRYRLKRRMLAAGKLRNECYECGLPATWNGMPLTLVLDHINGVNDDYRLPNLRLLCPNCNSQTPTFCGRNRTSVRSTARP